MATDSLTRYRSKRNFAVTSEPSGEPAPASAKAKPKRSAASKTEPDANGRKAAAQAVTSAALSFVVQKHAASHLHYDFRLELDGTLKSWAVPKGPSLDPHDKRMAVHVEDHPLSYGSFEGTIPPKQYGAGTVIVWDRGSWIPVGDPNQGYADGKLKFELKGHKLHGHWTLVRMRGRGEKQEPWLLIKEKDDFARPAAEYSVVDEEPSSVLTPDSAPASPPRARQAPSSTPAQAARKSGGKPSAKQAASDDLPLMLSPQLATLVDKVPSGPDWTYEVKFDGYRIMARVSDGAVRLFTRNGHDWTSKMPALAKDIAQLGLGPCWLDGEVIVQDEDGRPSFQLLQNAFDASRTGDIQYYVFDAPFLDGRDIRQQPLAERRAMLRDHLQAAPPGSRVRFSEDFPASAQDLLHTACQLRLEGIIGKRKDAPYVSRRSPTWVKLKCTQRQEFVIGGYTDPKGSRQGFGALLLGVHDTDGHLVYTGNVGTGFDEATLSSVLAKLQPLAAAKPAFHDLPRSVKAHWVKPKLVAEVSFSEWTHDGRVRHSVFHGLRTDKPANTITKESPVQAASSAASSPSTSPKAAPKPSSKTSSNASPRTGSGTRSRPSKETLVAGIRITHPDRVIDESTGITKLELAEYYAQAAKHMLPHLAARPVSLVRGPDGVGGTLFFQKHADARTMPEVRQLDPAFDPDHDPLLEVDSQEGLLGAVQMNVIEFHTWNATTAAIERPDRMTFDLDPGENVAWPAIQEAAQLTQALLKELGLTAFLKTSGGKGLHVVVPLIPEHGWDTVKDLSQAVVVHLAQTLPDRFVAKSGPRNRVGRIFIDYLRNGRGATTACAFSARARPGMGVSVPIAWDELAEVTAGDHWTVRNTQARFQQRTNPWSAYNRQKQTLAKAMKLLDFKA